MHISIEAEETVGIVNFYAPLQDNITEKLGFFKDLKSYLSEIKKKLIILGDFSFVEFNDDRTSGLTFYDGKIKDSFNIQDTFKSIHNTTNFTHKISRIEKIYVPQINHPKILAIQHLDGISDHKLVLLNLNLDKFKSWGNYYWKFNNTLLKNNPFQQEVKIQLMNII